MHIASANWNFGKITQALGRGIRIGTHKDMPPNTRVNIYLHCAIPMHDERWIENTRPISISDAIIDSSPLHSEAEQQQQQQQQQQRQRQQQQRQQQQQQQQQREKQQTALVAARRDSRGRFSQQGGGGRVFTPDQLNRSIDFHLYHLSEVKDRNIKNIEYSLLISAFDCQLEKAQNNRVGRYNDGSPECMYRSCAYKCLGIDREEIPLEELDDSTFNLYYTKESLPFIIEFLEKTFNSGKELWTFSELVDLGKKKKTKFTDRQIMDALLFCINKPYSLTTSDGRTLYINKTAGDVFYVSETRTQARDKKEAWSSLYTPAPDFDTRMPFDSLLHFFKNDGITRSCARMKECFSKRNVIEARKLLLNLTTLALGIFLQKLVTTPESSQNPFMIWMRDEVAAPLWLRDPINGAYLWRQSPTRILQLDRAGTEWIPLEKTRMIGGGGSAATAGVMEEESQDHEEQQFKKKYIRDNPFKMYGYIEDGEFKIRDVSGYEGTKTKRQKTRGRSCKTLDASTVYKYLYMLQPALPDDELLTGSPPGLLELRNRIRAMDIDEVGTKLKTIRGDKMQKIVDFIKNIKSGKDDPEFSISDEDKRFILFYTMMNLETLCELLERIFQQKQIYTKTPRKPAPGVKMPTKIRMKKSSSTTTSEGQDVVFPSGGGAKDDD
jgi:hypothetical protein